ncbi:hypothetical protein NL676_022254 [Syzygium grande]|nr:hypothetical protein NL676_022254 [Syzygium grande]
MTIAECAAGKRWRLGGVESGRTTQNRGEVELPVDVVVVLDASAGPCQDPDPTRFTPPGLATRPYRTRRSTGASTQPSFENELFEARDLISFARERESWGLPHLLLRRPRRKSLCRRTLLTFPDAIYLVDAI